LAAAATGEERSFRVPKQVFDLVLFGGTGDLAARKLLPALYHRFRGGDIAPESRIYGAARQALDDDGFRNLLNETVKPRVQHAFDEASWNEFLKLVGYTPIDARDPESFRRLAGRLVDAPDRARVFFLATTPKLFADICANLGACGAVTPKARVVLEKPLGHDLASSCAINDVVGSVFSEDRIYRIDHYLGKESVQNLLALRFGNAIFEPLWSRNCIRDVQITIAETVGVEGRGEFYDTTGALRDIVQNHLLQLLCIVAMEPPTSIAPDAVRDAKLQVLRALRQFTDADVHSKTVRGQYKAGAVASGAVIGYLDEPGIPPDSRTETFVAIKAELANWRWAGVPFYLRTGKRMQERLAEIVINFQSVPHAILKSARGDVANNRLVIRLQPDDALRLELQAKTPGESMTLQPFSLNLDFADSSKMPRLDAYERLLMDVIKGSLTLFARRDELEAAWQWVEPILHGWAADNDMPKTYTAGTWGPAASSALIGRDNCCWHEEA
jgi:glucose-6-phosphate 1-dehydrogenase